jgi:hypothetical protein
MITFLFVEEDIARVDDVCEILEGVLPVYFQFNVVKVEPDQR